MKKINLEGIKFGRLTVKDGGVMRGGQWYDACVCECGEFVHVRRDHLKSGRTKSCGCLNRQAVAERSRRHGGSHSQTYKSWIGMVGRTTQPSHPDFARYGGSGVDLDPRWLDYKVFICDMGERPDGTSIDRINNFIGYWPSNCRWATVAEQANNKVRTKNKTGARGVYIRGSRYEATVTINGVRKSLGRFSSIDEARDARCNFISRGNPDLTEKLGLKKESA